MKAQILIIAEKGAGKTDLSRKLAKFLFSEGYEVTAQDNVLEDLNEETPNQIKEIGIHETNDTEQFNFEELGN